MKIHFDPQADALYIRLDDSAIVESEEVKPGVILDYSAGDQVVGIEILRARERVPEAHLRRMDFEVA
jgi:uncharacterized protein YuzE